MVYSSAVHSSKLLLCQKHLISKLPFKLFQKKKKACEIIFLSYNIDLVKERQCDFFFSLNLTLVLLKNFKLARIHSLKTSVTFATHSHLKDNDGDGND